MRFPRFTSLYGRIFAIFWFTMLLVLIAVLTLPHLDPRKVRELPDDHLQRITKLKTSLEKRFAHQDNLSRILMRIEENGRSQKNKRPRFFITDEDGQLLTTLKHPDFKLRVLQNFITSIEDPSVPKQKLYGNYMMAGPLPIELAGQNLKLYVGLKWNQPPPLLLRLFDKPFQLLLAVMAVSTPLLLWLAWALSQPARKLERAAKRVANGEFEVDPELEKGTTEFRQAGASFNQMVEAVNQMLSGQQRLLSDISHELRSPLTRLRMATALASRKQGDSQELTRIDTEAQRLEQMIGELLALSRMQADSHLVRETHPISSLWEAILQDAEFEANQIDKVFVASEIPAVNLTGHPKLLMSAVENIIRNAISYAEKKIEVRISTEDKKIIVQCDDDGIGVPDEELESIFRPFYRVSTARDRHSGGTGLGLAITESAVRQHNGTITAQRSALGGLQVTICLPMS
ncbi:envelope stress sensor histidine kinase CpxA [Vibrio sonorensis]|uniref:envelope stress sensor histidine kinase CpxA n=1 Tax=Vibrio sonorensis TaxID=1004316 RepID=UPI0008D9FD7F|nr:envelope stress sensor histidine kinase CpxA [Vibrio sonorensis]